MLAGVIVGLIFSALLAILGLYRLFQYIKFYRHVYSGSPWPEILGTVVDGFTGYTPWVRGSRTYYAVIEYHYLVQGHQYMGELKKQTPGGERVAKRLVEKHPPQSTIQVHYNPAQPQEHVSVLDKSRSYLVWSLVFLLFGLLGVITAFAVQ